jgi:hypothetical protein
MTVDRPETTTNDPNESTNSGDSSLSSGQDPAEIQPTDNSSGAPPDLQRVEQIDRAAAQEEERGDSGSDRRPSEDKRS